MANIFTYTGKVVDFERISAESICIDDIAHALSYSSRYNGMMRSFYSIAQHSILVSQRCDPEFALEGLLHDAAEAYVGDVVSPLKNHPKMSFFREVEQEFICCIADKFDLCDDFRLGMHERLNAIDKSIVQDEVYCMGTPSYIAKWELNRGALTPPAKLIVPVDSVQSEISFLHAFSRLRRHRVRKYVR